MASLSRQLAKWVTDLDFKSLPPAVIDRAKGVTLHGLASALLGHGRPAGKQALELIKRVTIIASKTQPLMAPTVTIYTKQGKKYRGKATGREFMWDFNEEALRIRGVIPHVPISEPQFDKLITACRDLEHLARADELIRLMQWQAMEAAQIKDNTE